MRIPSSISRRGTVLAAGLLALALSACADDGPLAPDGSAPAAARGASDGVPGLQDRGPLERVQFVHYRRGSAKPPWAGGGGGDTGSTCYAFIASGAGWRTAEPWEVFEGTDGISATQLRDQVAIALGSWESAAGTNIAGSGSQGALPVNLNATDDHNVVTFGNVSYAGAIAVTNVWGYFRGPSSTRELVEWDMIFDDVDFNWSLTGAAGAMDALNIAAHEVGHALGMGHPANSCTEETMYAYAAAGETKKRSLNAGDIAGILDLY